MTAPSVVPVSLFDREGTSVRGATSIDSIIASAGLGFQVEKAGLHLVDERGFVDWKPRAYVTRNATTKHEFGVVGTDYEVVQTMDAFRVCEPLLDNGIITPVSAGSFRQGADPYLQFEWNREQFPVAVANTYGALGLKAFGLISANHEGRRQVAIGNCDLRVFCENTLAWATKEVIAAGGGIVHRKGAGERLIEVARTVWQRVIASHVETAKEYDLLAHTYLTESDFEGIVLDRALPLPKEPWDGDKPATITRRLNTIERVKCARDTVTLLWRTGLGHVADGSAWEAYNGLVEAIDHDDVAFKVNAKTSRLQSAYAGSLAEKKATVYGALLAFARAG